MRVTVTKVSEGHSKLLLLQRLHYTHQAAKYEVYKQRAGDSRSRNVTKFRAVSEIRGDFARLSRKW